MAIFSVCLLLVITNLGPCPASTYAFSSKVTRLQRNNDTSAASNRAVHVEKNGNSNHHDNHDSCSSDSSWSLMKSSAKYDTRTNDERWSELELCTCPTDICTNNQEQIFIDRIIAIFETRINAVVEGRRFSSSSSRRSSHDDDDSNEVLPNEEIPESTLSEIRTFVTQIVNLYNRNEYHSIQHCYNVVIAANMLLNMLFLNNENSKVNGIKSDPMTQLAFIFSALIHDAGHLGVTNQDLVVKGHDLAIKYDNQSVAENQSITVAFDELFKEGKYDLLRQIIFGSKQEAEYEISLKKFHDLVTELILDTDIFNPEQKATRENQFNEVFDGYSVDDIAATASSQNNDGDNALDNLKTTRVILMLMLRVADLSSSMKCWETFIKWSRLLYMEQREAFQSGRSLYDPDNEDWFNNQIAFLDGYLLGLAKQIDYVNLFGKDGVNFAQKVLAHKKRWLEEGSSVVRTWKEEEMMPQ